MLMETNKSYSFFRGMSIHFCSFFTVLQCIEYSANFFSIIIESKYRNQFTCLPFRLNRDSGFIVFQITEYNKTDFYCRKRVAYVFFASHEAEASDLQPFNHTRRWSALRFSDERKHAAIPGAEQTTAVASVLSFSDCLDYSVYSHGGFGFSSL